MRLPPLAGRVAAALREMQWPRRGEGLVLALSGGADSVALLDALDLLRRPFGFRLTAAHLDHGLREGSARDAAFCAALCAARGVPLSSARVDVRARAARERGGLEQAARRERHAFLRGVARTEGAAAIALAHTQDDQVETLLLRLLRGAGARGLAAMRPRAGELIRPLLGVSRAEVLAHLGERRLAWVEDPSNLDPAHRRNRVRHELLPYLEERFNPAIRRVLARTAALLADEAAHLRAEAEDLVAPFAPSPGDGLALPRASLAAVSPALARAAVRVALAHVGGETGIGAGHVERVMRLARSSAPGRRVLLPGGRQARLGREHVFFEPRVREPRKAV